MMIRKLLIAVAIIPAISFAANKDTVLGNFILGQSTVSEVTKVLEQRQCQFSQDNTEITVNQGCYNLPGQPVIHFYVDADKLIAVDIIYNKSMGSQEFEQYYNSLQKTFGKPQEYANPFVGDKYASWLTDKMYIFLNQPHLNFNGCLTYMTDELYQKIEKSKKQEQQQAKQDMEELI